MCHFFAWGLASETTLSVHRAGWRYRGISWKQPPNVWDLVYKCPHSLAAGGLTLGQALTTPGFLCRMKLLRQTLIDCTPVFLFFLAPPWDMWNFPDQGSNPRPLQWKLEILTTGPPGKSWSHTFVGGPIVLLTSLWCFLFLLSKLFFFLRIDISVLGFPSGSAVKNLPAMQEPEEMQVWYLGQEDPLEEEMQPIPVFLPGESLGQRSLVGYSSWGCKESDMTETSWHAACIPFFLW